MAPREKKFWVFQTTMLSIMLVLDVVVLALWATQLGFWADTIGSIYSSGSGSGSYRPTLTTSWFTSIKFYTSYSRHTYLDGSVTSYPMVTYYTTSDIRFSSIHGYPYYSSPYYHRRGVIETATQTPVAEPTVTGQLALSTKDLGGYVQPSPSYDGEDSAPAPSPTLAPTARPEKDSNRDADAYHQARLELAKLRPLFKRKGGSHGGGSGGHDSGGSSGSHGGSGINIDFGGDDGDFGGISFGAVTIVVFVFSVLFLFWLVAFFIVRAKKPEAWFVSIQAEVWTMCLFTTFGIVCAALSAYATSWFFLTAFPLCLVIFTWLLVVSMLVYEVFITVARKRFHDHRKKSIQYIYNQWRLGGQSSVNLVLPSKDDEAGLQTISSAPSSVPGSSPGLNPHTSMPAPPPGFAYVLYPTTTGAQAGPQLMPITSHQGGSPVAQHTSIYPANTGSSASPPPAPMYGVPQSPPPVHPSAHSPPPMHGEAASFYATPPGVPHNPAAVPPPNGSHLAHPQPGPYAPHSGLPYA